MNTQISFKSIVVLMIVLFAVVGGSFLVVEAISFMVAGVDGSTLAVVAPGDVSGGPLFDMEFIPHQLNPWGIDANRRLFKL